MGCFKHIWGVTGHSWVTQHPWVTQDMQSRNKIKLVWEQDHYCQIVHYNQTTQRLKLRNNMLVAAHSITIIMVY